MPFVAFFFFSSRRRHTRSLCDWSSDVCSSDLPRFPRAIGGCEVHVKPGTLGEPRPDERCFVRSVIVHDEVDVPIGWYAGVDAVQELAELDRPMAAMHLANHFAALGVERGKQRGGAMALVVVRPPLGLAGPHRQQPRGVLSSVRTTTCSISSSVILRGAPGRGSSYRPARRSRTNRVRHLPTVAGVARSRWATPLLSWPSAHASTMRARRASAGTERDRWARDSNSRRSSLFKISGALGRPVRMLPPYRARRIGLAICFSYFCYRTLAAVVEMSAPSKM